MKGRSCCSTCLFTGGSILGRRPLIFKHGGHISNGGVCVCVCVCLCATQRSYPNQVFVSAQRTCTPQYTIE